MSTKKPTARNFHVPLPPDLYDSLRLEAERSNQPATTIAKEAISELLRQRQKAALHGAIAEYTKAFAGTEFDLDGKLEAASIECWLAEENCP